MKLFSTYVQRPILAICCLWLFSTNIAFANNQSSIEFFASNNAKEINVQTAYGRLIGKEQSNLQNEIIKVLQKNHIEQGKFEDVLGTYRMSRDHNITADNTEHFTASLYQHLSNEKVFSIAKELAMTLHQDSVAVLIPNQSRMGSIRVTFISHQPTISETISMLHDKLPTLYNQAFSLHLVKSCSGFDNTKVTAIEWLGSKVNIDEIKKVFPTEKIDSHFGKVYLVYPNGQKQPI